MINIHEAQGAAPAPRSAVGTITEGTSLLASVVSPPGQPTPSLQRSQRMHPCSGVGGQRRIMELSSRAVELACGVATAPAVQAPGDSPPRPLSPPACGPITLHNTLAISSSEFQAGSRADRCYDGLCSLRCRCPAGGGWWQGASRRHIWPNSTTIHV